MDEKKDKNWFTRLDYSGIFFFELASKAGSYELVYCVFYMDKPLLLWVGRPSVSMNGLTMSLQCLVESIASLFTHRRLFSSHRSRDTRPSFNYELSSLESTIGIGTNSAESHSLVTARGRGRKNLGCGRSSFVIVNEGSGSFSVIISLIDRPVGYSLTYRINGLNEALRCASRLCLFVPVSVRPRDKKGKRMKDATKQVKDNKQYSWIGKTKSHSRKRTVDDSRPGRNRKRG
ncbi:unnamed protein product [Vicia faba]|uniref:Uncharacterized protein n=1 Tax=Vicia faba TaxID=3906 RepID=A0AAV1BAY6_VICFA|nr:unnamed protein product [Vicia faba]